MLYAAGMFPVICIGIPSISNTYTNILLLGTDYLHYYIQPLINQNIVLFARVHP